MKTTKQPLTPPEPNATNVASQAPDSQTSAPESPSTNASSAIDQSPKPAPDNSTSASVSASVGASKNASDTTSDTTNVSVDVSEGAPLTILQFQAKCEALQQETSQAQDKALRAQAELENFKKRILREQEEALRYANTNLLRDYLATLDNLELAITAANTAKKATSNQALQEGVAMVARQIQEIFSRHGMQQIHAQTEQPFDPDSHEALSTVASPTIKAGHIVDVFQVGWRYHQRVLRPARVSVAKDSSSDTTPESKK